MCMMLKARCNRHSGWGKGLLDQTKERMSRSKLKVILVMFFDWKGIVHHESVPRGQMVNKQFYKLCPLACVTHSHVFQIVYI